MLDVDFHHGNGTQDIFYERGDVYFASLHGDPVEAFPHFLGFADEEGAGAGLGTTKNYPLPLDLALPVFSWALVYRDGELWKIIPEVPDAELNDTTRFQKISNPKSKIQNPKSTFRIRKGTFVAGHYLRPNDLLRVEAISPELLREAAALVAQADLADDATVAFFHLDTAIIRRYPVQLLDSVCQMICFPEKRK